LAAGALPRTPLGELTTLPQNPSWWGGGWLPPPKNPTPAFGPQAAHIVNIWNSLPNTVVDVDTVCLFKAHLDKFWMHQVVKYDFTADLTGIGDRSVHDINIL